MDWAAVALTAVATLAGGYGALWVEIRRLRRREAECRQQLAALRLTVANAEETQAMRHAEAVRVWGELLDEVRASLWGRRRPEDGSGPAAP